MLSPARIATLVAFLAIAAIALFAEVDSARSGTPRATLVADGATSNDRFIVKAAPAGSLLHPGDRVEVRDAGELAALALHSLAAGSVLHVHRTAPLPAADLSEPVVGGRRSPFRVLVIVLEALFLAIASVIAAKGRASGSLSLAWLLACFVLLVNPATPAWPSWLLIAFGLGGGGIAVFAFFCATDFATRFTGDPDAAWARRARRISAIVAAAALTITLGIGAEGFLQPTSPPILNTISAAAFVAQALLFLVTLGIAFARAPALDRQRVAWVAASLTVGVIGFSVTVLLAFAGVPEPNRDYPMLLLIAMPLGCAYAILRYRLLDIAFVVNRATVFGVTSLLVLAALALVDYGLQTLLGSWLLRTGLYVQLGLALAIGIATRPIHDRVDALVDDLFFRRRHETERALRQFARDVAHIDDADVVLERTVETVALATHLRCAIYLLTADGLHAVAHSADDRVVEPVDRNDPAIIRLLATREPLELHQVSSALAGDFAFPMFARNRLLGVIVCASGADGSGSYAPDEREAIAAVAQACGIALDLLRIERLERELDTMRNRNPFEGSLR